MEFPLKSERLNLLVFEDLTTLNDKLMISRHLLIYVCPVETELSAGPANLRRECFFEMDLGRMGETIALLFRIIILLVVVN